MAHPGNQENDTMGAGLAVNKSACRIFELLQFSLPAALAMFHARPAGHGLRGAVQPW
jgi:hypothetical protein